MSILFFLKIFTNLLCPIYSTCQFHPNGGELFSMKVGDSVREKYTQCANMDLLVCLSDRYLRVKWHILFDWRVSIVDELQIVYFLQTNQKHQQQSMQKLLVVILVDQEI